VLVRGASAGAHLTSTAALTRDVKPLAPDDRQPARRSDCVQGFVGWYGRKNLESLRNMATRGSTDDAVASENEELSGGPQFLRCTASGRPADVVASASTITQLDARDLPSLLVHGTADALVPYA
jgi:hypothetical protein